MMGQWSMVDELELPMGVPICGHRWAGITGTWRCQNRKRSGGCRGRHYFVKVSDR